MNYKEASAYWTDKENDSVKMDRQNLLNKINEFLLNHNTCALACADGDFVRCTPIEYTWYDNCMWMFSEGGLKFRALENNKSVCAAVYDNYNGFSDLAGMQVTAKAQIVEPWSDEYNRMIEIKKIPAEALKKLSHPMYLIKLIPGRIDFLSSQFKKDGFDSRQFVEV